MDPTMVLLQLKSYIFTTSNRCYCTQVQIERSRGSRIMWESDMVALEGLRARASRTISGKISEESVQLW